MKIVVAIIVAVSLSVPIAFAQSPTDPADAELGAAWSAHVAAEQRLQNAIEGYAKAEAARLATMQKALDAAKIAASTTKRLRGK